MTPEVSARDLAVELQGENPPVLLDVRDPDELAINSLQGIIAIPIGQIVNRKLELDPTADTVVICHTGLRSGQVTEYLLDNGFPKVRNLRGGMKAWVREMDPSMPDY